MPLPPNGFERRSGRSPASSRDRWARRRNPPRQGRHPIFSGWNAPALAPCDSQPARRCARLSRGGERFPRRPRESVRIFLANPLVRAANRATLPHEVPIRPACENPEYQGLVSSPEIAPEQKEGSSRLEVNERGGAREEHVIFRRASGSRWVDTHQFAEHAGTANCGGFLRFWPGRIRRQESLPCNWRPPKPFGQKDRRQTNSPRIPIRGRHSPDALRSRHD